MKKKIYNQNFSPIKRKQLSVEELVNGILNEDRVILSQAITLIESNHLDHQAKARELVAKCLHHSGKSIRIGITGVPGVGKSSFIEASGGHLIKQYNRKLAVLAIDPSSSKKGGSILGDKTRMSSLAINKNAFIRPSPTSGSLGGVARKTRETIILCEAAGFDLIFVETVGVGQSEITVYDMVDCFLLLMLAGAGDQLQGIKRGIMEMADIVAITKADGENKILAQAARSEYDSAIRMFPNQEHKQTRSVLTCSSVNGEGIERLWETVLKFTEATLESGFTKQNRQNQSRHWMHSTIKEELLSSFYQNTLVGSNIDKMEKDVAQGSLSPFKAAEVLLELFQKTP